MRIAGRGAQGAGVTAKSGADVRHARRRAAPAPRRVRDADRADEALLLTARQKEVLRLVAQGHTNREIADQLDISVRTVEVHRFNLMRRLRVRNVAQLLRQGMLLRLIPKQAASNR